ncbi:uncharacterized protein LOC111121641 [Crassostrea virginica]
MMILKRLLFAIAFLKYTIHGFVIHGEIVLSNSTVYINEILELNCTLYRHSGFNVSMLYWRIPNGQSLSEKQVISLNEQTLQSCQKVTRDNEGGKYFCKVNDGNSTEIIDSAQVLIGDEVVQNVTNSTCILYDKRNEFICYWDLGKYHQPLSLRINASVSMDNNDQNLIPCPLLNISSDPTDRHIRVKCT